MTDTTPVQSTAQARSVESYAHKAAKATLAGWFRDAASEAHDDWVAPCGINFRVNRGGPYWGVWEEYPFADGIGDTPVWDEDDWYDRLEAKRVHGAVEYGLALRDCGHKTLLRVTAKPRRIGLSMNRWDAAPEFFAEYGGPSAPVPSDRQPHPTYGELKEIGVTPNAIVDVAIQHKGTILYAFEVVHKHGLTDRKRAFLQTLSATTIVLSANWILSQISPPNRLVVMETINNFGNEFEHMRTHG